jgi:hypothetical protein
MAIETANKRKFETFLPAAAVLGSFRFVRLAPHFGQDDRRIKLPTFGCHAEASQWPGYSLWVVVTEVANRLVLAAFALEICEIHNPASVCQNMQE